VVPNRRIYTADNGVSPEESTSIRSRR
jgi:hypothetical protein